MLNKEIQDFISKNYRKDLTSLILRGSPFPGVTPQELAVQLKGKRIAERKFPIFFRTEGILYPPSLNLEQASSETTARYKSELVSGSTLIDLTGGLGIDSFFFADSVNQVFHCELDKELSEIAKYNFRTLKRQNIKGIHGDGLDFLKNLNNPVDWIYVDPSRRSRTGGKVFKLSDCSPDVIANADLLWKNTSHILVKTSPLLDLMMGIQEFQYVREIHILAIANEVKELLWVLDRSSKGTPFIKSINFEGDKQQVFGGKTDEQAVVKFDFPKEFVYEPNAAIMKSGLFDKVSADFQIAKLHQNTHLYTSSRLFDFPGRRFRVKEVLPYKVKFLSKAFSKADISTRNFPESVAKIRKTTGIKEGGNSHLIFCTTLNNAKVVLDCERC